MAVLRSEATAVGDINQRPDYDFPSPPTAARKSLYMPGAAIAKRLEARGMAPKAIVGASMRRLIHMIYGVLKSNMFFNAEIPMQGLAVQDGTSP